MCMVLFSQLSQPSGFHRVLHAYGPFPLGRKSQNTLRVTKAKLCYVEETLCEDQILWISKLCLCISVRWRFIELVC